MLYFAVAVTAPSGEAADPAAAQAALSLLVLIAAIAAWFGLRALVRDRRARRAARATGGRFADFVLQALVNAAKLDGRAEANERRAVAGAAAEATAGAVDVDRVEAAFAQQGLGKDELIAFLAARANAFDDRQKAALLKALLAVFVADGRFDEKEHAALIDYTEAIGYDRIGATARLRGLARDMAAGNIV